MARSWPIYNDRFLSLGLAVLHEPGLPNLSSITRVLMRYADSGPCERAEVANGIRELLAGSTLTRSNVELMQQEEMAAAEAQVNIRPATRGLRGVRKDPAARLTPDTRADWDQFAEEIDTAPITGPSSSILQQAAATVRNGRGLTTAWGQEIIRRALYTPDSAAALEAALTHVAAATPSLFIALRDHILPDMYRSAAPSDSYRRPSTE
jgi:hypothetical protein